MNKLTGKQKLAAYLLSIYWTGAGDAGTDRMIFDFHKEIGIIDRLITAHEDGSYTMLTINGETIIQTQ